MRPGLASSALAPIVLVNRTLVALESGLHSRIISYDGRDVRMQPIDHRALEANQSDEVPHAMSAPWP
jgi:hypothetical protein